MLLPARWAPLPSAEGVRGVCPVAHAQPRLLAEGQQLAIYSSVHLSGFYSFLFLSPSLQSTVVLL